jgi:hypothetical protein
VERVPVSGSSSHSVRSGSTTAAPASTQAAGPRLLRLALRHMATPVPFGRIDDLYRRFGEPG